MDMTTLLGKDACSDCEGGWPVLARIFRPVCCDLKAVEMRLGTTLGATNDATVREIIDFLLESPGKRIRPALVLLSAGAACARPDGERAWQEASVDLAAAVELIHMASLVHDDLIDGATVRHHRASIQAKWGRQVAVSVGDYLCARAFRLVADCADPRLFAILGSQLVAMCEGELLQVVSRGDFSLCERHCLAVIEKKTAALFGASCGAGAIVAGGEPGVCQALQEFGFHIGTAFQILDDCKDLLSDQEQLGKPPGQDLWVGDVTLPLLCAIRYCDEAKGKATSPSLHGLDDWELGRVRQALHSSRALERIAQWVGLHVGRATQALGSLADSDSKASLRRFTDSIAASTSRILAG